VVELSFSNPILGIGPGAVDGRLSDKLHLQATVTNMILTVRKIILDYSSMISQ